MVTPCVAVLTDSATFIPRSINAKLQSVFHAHDQSPQGCVIRWNLTLCFPLIKVGHYTRFQILAVLDSICSKPAALLLFEMTHQTLTATALEKRMVMVGGVLHHARQTTSRTCSSQYSRAESVLAVAGREAGHFRLFDQAGLNGFWTAGTRQTCLCLKSDHFLH